MAASRIPSILRRAVTALRGRSRMRQVLMILGDLEIGSARALCMRLGDDSVVLYRATTQRGALLSYELFALGAIGHFAVHVLFGAEPAPGRPDPLLAADRLAELVPDIREREIFLCGPIASTDAVLDGLRTLAVPAAQVHLTEPIGSVTR